jgi:GDP-D-mannose dehydratase
MLVATRDAKVKSVVYPASHSAYGDTPTLPKHEEMRPDQISPYAVAKRASENYMISFYRCYGMEAVCSVISILWAAAGSVVALLGRAGEVHHADVAGRAAYD